MATYVVQTGDSLSKIGAKHGVSWNSIAIANNIPSPYTIFPGQRLTIPSESGVTPGSNVGGASVGDAQDFNPIIDKLIGGILLYGIFRVLMKVF